MPPRKSLRLVHTSDVHLDDGSEIARLALTRVVDATIAMRADLLLFAGDVFDHNRVADEVVASFLREIDRLAAPVVVLPGNHDCYDAGSVYARTAFRQRADQVHVIEDEAGQVVRLSNLGLDVWGRPVVDHSPRFRPMAGLPHRSNGSWFIAVAHGHFQPDADGRGGGPFGAAPRSSPITPDDIATAGCDYVALGHWDRFADVSRGGVLAAYSGPPYTTAGGSSLGEVSLVELVRDERPRLDRISLAR